MEMFSKVCLALHVSAAQVEFIRPGGCRNIVRKGPALALGRPRQQQFHDTVHQAVLNVENIVTRGLAHKDPTSVPAGAPAPIRR